MTISEKVAYLKGLAEGLGLDTEKSKEGKLISVMVGILEEIGLSIEDLEENSLALGEEIDAVADGLSELEAALPPFEPHHHHHHGHECCDDFDFPYRECPSCGSEIYIDEEVLEAGAVTCEECNNKFVIDFQDIDEDEE